MVEHNQEDSTSIEVKNLSKNEALEQYNQLFADEAANIIMAYQNLDKLFLLLQQAGYSRTESITKMSNDAAKAGLKGFSQATIYRRLPEEIKGPTKPGPRKNKLSNDKLSLPPNQATLQSGKTVEEIVNKHPPKQTVVEQEKEERWKFNALNWQQKKRSLGDVPVSDTKIEWKVVKNTGNLTEEEAKEAMDIVTSAMKPPQPLQFTLSIKVVDSRTWSQAIGQARYLNEPIILIPNKQGELNLKV